MPEYSTLLRFQFPLIEPDVRISRIRLSDPESCLRPRDGGTRKPLELQAAAIANRWVRWLYHQVQSAAA